MLPQLLRKLMPVSIVVFVIVTILACVVLAGGSFLSGSMRGYASAILLGLVILWGISFIIMMVLALGVPLIRSIENALLRGLGKSGTATVEDIRTMIEHGRYGHDRIVAVRIKLNVHTPESGTFESVAEDSGDAWDNGDSELKVGQEVQVKYSPLTREVVLMTPKHKQAEEPEAKSPDW